jgi:cytochrome c
MREDRKMSRTKISLGLGVTMATMMVCGMQLAVADEALAKANNCLACHTVDKKLVGPALKDIAAKYKDDAGARDTLIARVKQGGSGVWGPIPMPPNAAVSDENIATLVDWILSL